MSEGLWLVLARFVQFTFLGLVGISLNLSRAPYKKQFLRGLKVFGLGMTMTLATYIFAPAEFVKFGILHLIGFSIIFLSPLSKKKYLNLLLAILIFSLGMIIQGKTGNSFFEYIIGFTVPRFNSLDHFPLFPWLSLIFLGMFLGHYAKKLDIHLPRNPVNFLGRHSLFVYIIHIPLIILLLIFAKILPLAFFI